MFESTENNSYLCIGFRERPRTDAGRTESERYISRDPKHGRGTGRTCGALVMTSLNDSISLSTANSHCQTHPSNERKSERFCNLVATTQTSGRRGSQSIATDKAESHVFCYALSRGHRHHTTNQIF